jgi:hypothetical protein
VREEFEVLNCATCVLALIISFVDSAARIPAGEFSISLSPALVRYRTCCYRPFDLAVPRTARALHSTRSHSTPVISYTEYIVLFYFILHMVFLALPFSVSPIPILANHPSLYEQLSSRVFRRFESIVRNFG